VELGAIAQLIGSNNQIGWRLDRPYQGVNTLNWEKFFRRHHKLATIGGIGCRLVQAEPVTEARG
jgi:hypothetical protein